MSSTTLMQCDITVLHVSASAIVSRPCKSKVTSGAASFSAMARPIPRLAPVIKYRFIAEHCSGGLRPPEINRFGAHRAPLQLRSSQCKPIVRRLPQTQAHQFLFKAIVDLGPKRAHDIFASRSSVAKIFRLQIKMSILPGREGFLDRAAQSHEIVKRSAFLVVLPADRGLGQISVAVT